jgi:ribosomal protein S18 acetylase RimI-like enzyme
MTPIRIRDANLTDSNDAAGIIEVLDSYATDPVGGGKPLSSDVRERLVAALSAHPHTLVLLAFDGTRPVGVAVCFFGLSTFQARPLLNIHDLAVIPKYRGQGIGRALLAEIEQRAVARGCCKLTLEVQDDNVRAHALYRDFGFGDFVLGESRIPTRFLSKTLRLRS